MVNVATLHYYFSTKQALVEGVAQFIGEKFMALHGRLLSQAVIQPWISCAGILRLGTITWRKNADGMVMP